MRNNNDNGQFIYFIRCPHTGLVKIGKTKDLVKRISFLQVEYEVDFDLLFYLKPNSEVKNHEHEIHEVFQEYRVDYPIGFDPTNPFHHGLYIRGLIPFPQGYTEWFDFTSPSARHKFLEFVLRQESRDGFSQAAKESISWRTEQGRRSASDLTYMKMRAIQLAMVKGSVNW